MKKLILLSTILSTATLISGCHTYSKTGQTVPVAPVVQSPIFKADYDINMATPKTGDSQSVYLLGFLRVAGDSTYAEAEGVSSPIFTSRLTKVRAAAIYKALEGKNNVYLVNPQYKTAVSTYLFGLVKTYRVNVTGYEATLKGIRQISN